MGIPDLFTFQAAQEAWAMVPVRMLVVSIVAAATAILLTGYTILSAIEASNSQEPKDKWTVMASGSAASLGLPAAMLLVAIYAPAIDANRNGFDEEEVLPIMRTLQEVECAPAMDLMEHFTAGAQAGRYVSMRRVYEMMEVVNACVSDQFDSRTTPSVAQLEWQVEHLRAWHAAGAGMGIPRPKAIVYEPIGVRARGEAPGDPP